MGRDSLGDLAALLKESRKLMAVIGVEVDPSVSAYTSHLNAAIMGLMIEAGEVGDEINTVTRPWNRKPLETVRVKMIEETIDALFYLLEIWNLLGVTDDEVQFQFEVKLATNFKRVVSTFDRKDIESAVAEAQDSIDGGGPQNELMGHWMLEPFDYDSYRHHPLRAAVCEIIWNDAIPDYPKTVAARLYTEWILKGGRK